MTLMQNCESALNPNGGNSLLVAMSGGVDSAAAACLLVEKGYRVGGGTMRLFDGLDTGDAGAVCDALGIEHHVFDFSDIFSINVMDAFAQGYLSGLTPNPCVLCNKILKFGAFLQKAEELGYAGMATGHYARIEREPSGRYLLKKAADKAKDQSYVLYSLTQAQLSKTLLPLGALSKAESRKIAEAAGLRNSQKPDSQDICFIKDGTYKEFIERHTGITPEEGAFVDVSGAVVGRHRGIINYTVGQRKGIGIASAAPLYVCGKDACANTVTLGGEADVYTRTLKGRAANLIAADSLSSPVRATIRTRYNGVENTALVHQISETEIFVEFDRPQRAVAPGQAVVFYDGDTVIGGATICS